MKLETGTPLKTFTGDPINDAQGPVTIGKVAIAALLASYADEMPTGEEKLWRYNLARRLNVGGEVEISTDDAALIKRLVGKAYGAVVVGPVYEAIGN